MAPTLGIIGLNGVFNYPITHSVKEKYSQSCHHVWIIILVIKSCGEHLITWQSDQLGAVQLFQLFQLSVNFDHWARTCDQLMQECDWSLVTTCHRSWETLSTEIRHWENQYLQYCYARRGYYAIKNEFLVYLDIYKLLFYILSHKPLLIGMKCMNKEMRLSSDSVTFSFHRSLP